MRTLIISHENDIDGMGSLVLAKTAFPDFDYLVYPSVAVLEAAFRKMLEEGTLDCYDQIFITDLALANPSLSLVTENKELSSKIQIFDHHQKSIDECLDIYPFTHIKETNSEGRKCCGTELFYEYLLAKHLLEKTPVLDDFVELTRLEDTWDWKNAGNRGLKAHDMAILFSIVGIENYIESMHLKTKEVEGEIDFTDEELEQITQKKREYEAALENFWQNTEVFIDEDGFSFGVVFANYEYRNEIAEYIRKQEDKKGISYIIIIAMDAGLYGQKSYRSIDPEFDVNKVASRHGGGGHKKAASVNITRQQKEKSLTLQKRESLEYLSNSNFTDTK